MRKSLYQQENLAMLALLRAEREGRGFLQTDLSRKLGKPQSYISKIERGERRLDVIELRGICNALGFDPAEFVVKLERQLGKASYLCRLLTGKPDWKLEELRQLCATPGWQPAP